MYLRGPWKKARATWKKSEPSEKNKLNLAGDIRIKGKNVKASKKNMHPIIMKAVNA